MGKILPYFLARIDADAKMIPKEKAPPKLSSEYILSGTL